MDQDILKNLRARNAARFTSKLDEPPTMPTAGKMDVAGDQSVKGMGKAESEKGIKNERFGDAFRRARARGAKTFEWRGKKYTTDLAPAAPPAADPAVDPAAAPASPAPLTPGSTGGARDSTRAGVVADSVRTRVAPDSARGGARVDSTQFSPIVADSIRNGVRVDSARVDSNRVDSSAVSRDSLPTQMSPDSPNTRRPWVGTPSPVNTYVRSSPRSPSQIQMDKLRLYMTDRLQSRNLLPSSWPSALRRVYEDVVQTLSEEQKQRLNRARSEREKEALVLEYLSA